MSSLRLWLMLAGASVCFGCAGMTPATAQSKPPAASNGDDEYEGWLFKSLTGRSNTAEAARPATATPTATSTSAVGPLVAGPASSSGLNGATSSPGMQVIPVSAESDAAGPPPSIPPELSSMTGGVSIGGAKPKEEKKGFDLSDLAPENIYKNVKNATGYGPDEKIARAAMKEGETLFEAKNYKEAAAKFATAAGRWPDSPLEEAPCS